MTTPPRPDEAPWIIEPIDFRTRREAGARRPSARRAIVVGAWSLVIVALVVAGWFVMTARQVQLITSPAADRVELSGPLPRLRIGDRWLLRRGVYEVRAELAGHHPLDESFEVSGQSSATVELTLRELPGLLVIRCVSGADGAPVDDVALAVDGAAAVPTDMLELARGAHALRLDHERYQTLETEVVVRGLGERQEVTLELRPDWAEVTIESTPTGAEVLVDGQPAGVTPGTFELQSGARAVELRAEGFEPWSQALEIVAEQPVAMEPVTLEPARGRLVITSDPPGAQVVVDGAYLGTTPIETPAASLVPLSIRLSRDGYDPVERMILLEPSEVADIDVELTPQLGRIALVVEPADATLFIDGVEHGPTPESIELPAREHVLEFRRPGYETAQRTIRPRQDLLQRIELVLRSAAVATATPATMTAPNGAELVLIRPGTFTMGASRREQGRRSNETLRTIRLDRPFLMGVHEVTNAEFASFKPSHGSGIFETLPLGGREQPVVQVTWDDAARYCNWLSAQQQLPSAYEDRNGRMVAVEPMTAGYRLPTEAEWAYAARVTGGGDPLRYPWGDGFPPTVKSGNYADESASGVLNVRIPEYEDGFAGPAPVGSFAANGRGLHDLGGNVSEWCHDFYTIHTYDPEEVAVDPSGPAEGRHHVVRGASWRDASISDLRLSHRDYDDASREDLGFRICRYLASEEDDH